ncbi:MAG: NAD-dependent epimerase/dehydratase family protein [Anaerolineae bacterium]|nr:NAD-dependent epimerase/dehydratase family protein [Anaerolineae bacterium]
MLTVVTGATGHVGANLVRALLAQKRQVRALALPGDDWRPALGGLDIEIAEGDVRDIAALRAAFACAAVVYHLASYISLKPDDWPRLESINVFGARNVVQACMDCKVRRLVYFSSIHALIQEPLDAPVDETRALVTSRRYPPYDRSKAAGQMEVLRGAAAGLDAIIINPTGIIGPHDYVPSHFGAALLAMARGKLPALLDAGFDWVDVRDVVAGAMQAEARAPAGAQYLLSGRWASQREIAQLVEQITGAPVPRLVIPMWLARMGIPFVEVWRWRRMTGQRALFTRDTLHALRGNRAISHARAARDLGYRPRPLEETIADTLRWFETNGYLQVTRGTARC